jgi:1-acyl-sn-glycerol-3-phosphate acyltransferase
MGKSLSGPTAERQERLDPVTDEDAHRYAREKGVSKPLYALVAAILKPLMRLWFRMHIEGADRIPESGAAILAPNHKSFGDSFFLGVCTRRKLRFMAKTELFRGTWGPVLARLGAFPVKRGEADDAALLTARAILEQGGLLALFPEGTRVRDPDGLGEPKRGAGRLALESGAPMVPCAITGTEDLLLGPFPKPKRVQVSFADPIPAAELPATPQAADELIEDRLWPEVEGEYRRLRSRPTLVAAAVTALGLGGLALFRRR